MSVTLCIKYALARVTVEDVTWVFNELCGGVVVKVSELVKQDRYSGKDFKIFFIECEQTKQTGSSLDKLVKSITNNMEKGDKKGARVSIDEYGHYWQVTLAIKQPGLEPKAAFKPHIVEEPEPSVEELEKAMDALQTKDELDFLHGHNEEGEIREDGTFEIELAEDDPNMKEAIEESAAKCWPYQAPR